MPLRDAVNAHRVAAGAPELSEAEFAALAARPEPEPLPEADERTIKIRMGLIDPNEEETPA